MGILYRVISRYLHVVYYISSLSSARLILCFDIVDIVYIPDLLCFFVSEGSV